MRHGIEAAQKAIQNPARAKMMLEIDKHSQAYDKGFEQIVELIHRRNALAGDQLNKIAPEIRETLSVLNEMLTKQGDYQRANLAVNAIQTITDTIVKISEINTAVASAVEEQGSATQEIARNVQEAVTGTQEVSSGISNVTRAAGETGAAATQVLNAAEELAKQSDRLQSEVDGFLNKIRAA